MPRWLFVAAAVLSTIVIASSYELVLYGGLATDPPSVNNLGPGGLSLIFTKLKLRGVEVVELRSIEVLDQLNPRETVLVIASPDTPLAENEVDKLLEWVSRGGKLVVMDELGSTMPLLSRLGITLGDRVHGISLGYCRLGGLQMSVLFDVYAPVYGGEPICTTGNTTVAVRVGYGKGYVLIYGDSSIAINEVIASPYRGMQEQYLYNVVFNRPVVAFYEARFLVVETRFSPAAILLMTMFAGSLLLSKAILSLDLLGRAAAIVLMTIVVLFFVVSRIGFHYEARASKERRGGRETVFEAREQRGVEEWKSWLGMQSGSKQ